jgi:hypothetical protein
MLERRPDCQQRQVLGSSRRYDHETVVAHCNGVHRRKLPHAREYGVSILLFADLHFIGAGVTVRNRTSLALDEYLLAIHGRGAGRSQAPRG